MSITRRAASPVCFGPPLGSFALALVIAFTLVQTSGGDSVSLIRTRFAMRGCTIQAIQSAQVFYLDPAGQRQRRAVEEVWALSFDGLAKLDEAEEAIEERDYDTARKRLLEAMLATDSPMQQLWIRNRLLRIHGLRNEFAEACAHLAEIFVLDPDPYWARVEPRCDAVPTTYAAAVEAMEALKRAERAVKVQAIQQAIDSMTRKLQPILDELQATYDGPPIEAGSTLSGVLKENIGTWDDAPQAAQPEPQPEDNDDRESAPAPAPPESRPVVLAEEAQSPAAPAGPDSPGAIEAHLKNNRFDDALEICERVADDFDDRDPAQFLFQNGEALRHTEKPRDAAVMYMRAAVLYPASPYAGPCLIETALLYRDTFNRPETARRLLERVAQDAERAERNELAQRARTLLAELNALAP